MTPGTSTGVALISVADNGENQIVIVQGANNHLSVADVENTANLIKNADVLIGQLETPFETTLAAFKLNNGVSKMYVNFDIIIVKNIFIIQYVIYL